MTTDTRTPATATSDDEGAFVPWTICLPDEDGYSCADLEHHAPLPRVGDAVAYIDEGGTRHWYRVREVVHTVQPASSGQVRAGLPRVYVEQTDPPHPGALMNDSSERDRPDAGAYIGRKPEFATETIPGDVGPDDERVAAGDTQSSGTGSADERVQGRDDEVPGGHREGPQAGDDDVREAGKNR